MNRRQFLAATIATASTVAASASLLRAAPTTATRPSSKPPLPDNIAWHDVRDWGVEGKAFDDVENYFDRLPARAKGKVPSGVWNHSKSSAGMSVRFVADSDAVFIRYQLTRPALAMEHMPATGVSGVDLYAQTGDGWRWLATCQPGQQSVADQLVSGILPGKRGYQINLPLYNGISSMEIGVPRGATFEPLPPRKSKPILFYGTSVTQGGVASRPGMAYVSILGRRLDQPILNFGFSGSGRMETEVGQFFSELDPAIYVIDCLGNMSAVPIESNCKALVHQLRKSHPDTPILLVEEHGIPPGNLMPQLIAEDRRMCGEQRSAYDSLIQEGVKNLHYQAGASLIGNDGEGTVDGAHPNDLGMMRYADVLEPVIRKILAM